ncbi:unnamed protein product [Lymnaea stagnalis]|uniref:Sphingomyelin phosphodiesterase 4 n=1 Tax=Lymnaea stagnalis TaxID=6523 RepID=A0AAV2IJD4_LYMST
MAAYCHLIERLTANQNKPLLKRCQIMEEIIHTTSLKELKSSFPYLLHEIFDFERDKNPGWQIDKISRYNNPELFECIRKMLSPEGPLMKVVNSLHSDPSAVYEFPLKYIPTPARLMIEGGAVPAFYGNKLQLQNFSPASDAFELFVFHLAFALVNPIWQARNHSWSDFYEYVYPTILDDMLVYFLPCDKNSLPSVPHFSGPSMRPTILSYASGRPYNKTAVQVSPPGYGFGNSHRSLFKSSFLNAQKQHMQSMPVFDQAETEIWRSETFLQVLTEFWLNQNSSNGNELVSYSSGLQFSALHRDPFKSMFDQFMPTINHIKMVRLLVKYMHYFANSATSSLTSPFQQNLQSPLDQFKRSVIPHILQKKLYTFLRHAFSRWPLDSYFRMVLEIWLSYIQPWRYIVFVKGGLLLAQHSDTDVSIGKLVENKWDSFVEDNLLFYTVLTSEFIPRIYRMDMTSPYSAYMVYRVSRVTVKKNVCCIHLEAAAFSKPFRHIYFLFESNYDQGGSYLSGQSLHIPFVLPSYMLELEGPNFQYNSFFSDAMKENMMKVVGQLCEALDFVRSQQIASTKPERNAGFFSSIFGLDNGTRNVYLSPEYKRLPGHLEQAIMNFCTIFNVMYVSDPHSHHSPLNTSIANESMYLSEPDQEFPDCVETEDGLKLTDLGRRQLINKQRKFDKFYVGDPDLLPIRSYENASLVRVLFYFCSFINSYFRSEMISLYNSQKFAGRFAQVFLIPPTTLQDIQHKFHSPVTVQTAHLIWSQQPHISLRFLASYHFLVKLAITYVIISFIFEFGPAGFLIIMATLVFLYGFVLASVRHLKKSSIH